jgi:hypothetical protein
MNPTQVFLSYPPEKQDFVESIARQLFGDARLSFWFAPWHSIPGVPVQEQMEKALQDAQACAIFIGGTTQISGWQNEQMRATIQLRVEDDSNYRIIPVLLPGVSPVARRDLPLFLRRYQVVDFSNPGDQAAYQRLVAGILGIPPIQVDQYILNAQRNKQQRASADGGFQAGHALVVGIAHYPAVRGLPENVLDDARDLADLLQDPNRCGYPSGQVLRLLDEEATASGIRSALSDLAQRAGTGSTAVVYFSGHGWHHRGTGQQFLVPYDADSNNLVDTCLSNQELSHLLSEIQADRLLVLFDACHSGGVGDPKDFESGIEAGLPEEYYQNLAQGVGRVIIASSRPEEVSWVLQGMRNSLFTHYLLEALTGFGPSLGDGYVRVFDIFRYIAERVPERADQHPIFKAAALELDFPVAWVGKHE